MKWFEGSIAEAVNLSKQRDSVFVVYVEGNDELSLKLRGFIDEDKIKSKLQSDNFVAIKIDSGSEAYMQFAQIYQLVPLPSIFFIGKNGAPIQVVTGVIATSDELEYKINSVLETVGLKDTNASDQLKNESSNVSAATTSNAAAASQNLIASEQSNLEMVCDGDVCFLRPKSKDQTTAKPPPHGSDVDSNIFMMPSPPLEQSGSVPDVSSQTQVASSNKSDTQENTVNAEAAAADAAAKVERAKQLIEEKRKEKEEEEKQLERERELKRRKEGQDMQNLKKWQKEQELQQLKENIRREREEEQAARQRILEKIASDRAERAQKFTPVPAPSKDNPEPSTSQNKQSPKPSTSSEFSRIQFRKPEGETSSHTFKSSEQFQVVRDYVRSSILSDAGIREFSLATTFPRREFTSTDDSTSLLDLGLCPSAVLLVIAGQRSAHSPSAIVARSGGVVNVFNTIFWGLLSPVFAVFGYIRRFFSGQQRDTTSTSNTGAQKRASEDTVADNDAAKRRNIDRLLNKQFVNDEPSTSSADKSKKEMPYRRTGGGSNIHRLRENKDSDDENNTWNGNSTQQQ